MVQNLQEQLTVLRLQRYIRNKADMEIEATGWVSEETDDALEAIELTLTPQEINEICEAWETVQ